MDTDYICRRLPIFAGLIYGKDSEPFAKEKDGKYIFGSKKDKIKNIVTKEIAIYLIAGLITNKDEKHKTNKKKISKSRKKTKKSKK